MRMKLWKKILIGLGLTVVVAMLLINPKRTNPPVAPGRDLLASNTPPAEIVTILRNACYDCHSHETKWPWYSRVAPVSWWVVDHVNHGREELNFSEWPHDDPKRAARRLRSMGDVVMEGEMPLSSYVKGHPEALLSDQQRDAFSRWAEAEADRMLAILEAAAIREREQ
jgi:hypothetical protein